MADNQRAQERSIIDDSECFDDEIEAPACFNNAKSATEIRSVHWPDQLVHNGRDRHDLRSAYSDSNTRESPESGTGRETRAGQRNGQVRSTRNNTNIAAQQEEDVSHDSAENEHTAMDVFVDEDISTRTESFLTAAEDISHREPDLKRKRELEDIKHYEPQESSGEPANLDADELNCGEYEGEDSPDLSFSCASCHQDKPKSPFMIFMEEFRENYRKEYSSLTEREITDFGAEVWAEMSKEKKLEFQLRSNEQERQFSKKQCSRPKTAYQIFMKDFLDREYEKRKHFKTTKLTRRDVFQKGVRKWKRMPKSEKAIYEDRRLYATYMGQVNETTTV